VIFWDSNLFKELFGFTGWITIPALVSILKTQGMVVVMNTAFGPVFNAAQSISNQVNNAVKSLANNVGAAFSPQITITYAQNDYTSMTRLFLYGSKITFFLFAYMFLPLCVEIDFVLGIWLKEVPIYTNTIVRLIMIDTLIASMTSCFNIAIRATGNIRFYEVTYNLFHLFGLALVFILVKLGCDYYVPYIVLAVFSLLSISIQLYCMKRVLPFVSIRNTVYSMLQMIMVVLIAAPIVIAVASCSWANEWVKFCFVVLISSIVLTILIYGVGLTPKEKGRVISFIKVRINKHR
jgi:O-antigen/teichoic acid export membrane protein